jgi:cytochrome c biogenesis protein CcmG/thiol:disulfide interchange protein DsbE
VSRGWYRLLYVVPFALFLGLALFVLYDRIGGNKDPRRVDSPLIDKPAPDFSLPALRPGDAGVSRADLLGKVRLVNFFASWCIPCRAEHPILEALHRGGIEIVGIAYKDKPEASLAWLDQFGDPYTRTAADQDGRVAIDWGVYGVPETYLVDAAGVIRFKQVGPLSPGDVETKLMPALKSIAR